MDRCVTYNVRFCMAEHDGNTIQGFKFEEHNRPKQVIDGIVYDAILVFRVMLTSAQLEMLKIDKDEHWDFFTILMPEEDIKYQAEDCFLIEDFVGAPRYIYDDISGKIPYPIIGVHPNEKSVTIQIRR